MSISIIVKSAGQPFEILPASIPRIEAGPDVRRLIVFKSESLSDLYSERVKDKTVVKIDLEIIIVD